MKLIAKTFLLIGLLIYATPASAQTADMINFQARILDNDGVPLEGTHEFVFAIVDENETILWGPPEVPSVNLTVTEGLYSIKLGDPALGMPPLGMEVFEGQELTYLRVAVDGEQLTEDQQILPVVYAFHAEHAITADEAEHAGQVDYADSSGYADNWDGGDVSENVGFYGNVEFLGGDMTYYNNSSDESGVQVNHSNIASIRLEAYNGTAEVGNSIYLGASTNGSCRLTMETPSWGEAIRIEADEDDGGGAEVRFSGPACASFEWNCNDGLLVRNSQGQVTFELDAETGNIYYTGELIKR